MFEGDSKGEGKGNKKKDKVSLQHAPQSVFITLMESQIEVKTPTSWKQSDVLVPIDATTLTNLCDYILEDVSCCLQKEGKRAYQQSGKFAKRPKEAEWLQEGGWKECCFGSLCNLGFVWWFPTSELFRWAMKSLGPWLFVGYIGDELYCPCCIGIINNKPWHEDPVFLTNQDFMESKAVVFCFRGSLA